MSDENAPVESTPEATPPAPRKPPTGLVIAGLAVTTLIIAVTLLRGRTSTQPSTPAPAPAATATPSAPDDAAAEVPADVIPLDPDAETPPPLIERAGTGGTDVLALFAPLRPGSEVGGARIERISEVVDGRVMIDLRIGALRESYGVMLHSDAATSMLRAGNYVIYVHGQPRPEFREALPALLAALQRNVSAGAAATPPEGMRPFERDAPR